MRKMSKRALTGISKFQIQFLEELATLLISCFQFNYDDQLKFLLLKDLQP